jgi:aspartate aminotransferase-like enzyme
MTSLLDLPTATAADVATAEDCLARLLNTGQDVVLLQGEAILALEAAARGLGRPGKRALNIVTGPYGVVFGDWLRASGSEVVDLTTGFDEVAGVEAVARALAGPRFDIVSIVHAEAVTGGLNPIDEIAGLVREHGALLVVDAVASLGADPVSPDAWDADIVAIGPQKMLAGPAGVSALSISPGAWEALEANPSAPRGSYLSLLDLKHAWIDPGRTALPGYVASLETFALLQALDRVEAEGLQQVIRRHRDAATAGREGLRALGLSPWIRDDAGAAAVATTFAVPDEGFLERARSAGARITGPAPGPLAGKALRINHTGRVAGVEAVQRELTAYGVALRG